MMGEESPNAKREERDLRISLRVQAKEEGELADLRESEPRVVGMIDKRENQSQQDITNGLQQEIREFIEQAQAINVAGDLFQRLHELRERLEQRYPDIDWSSSKGVSNSIEEALLNRYQLQLAGRLRSEQEKTDCLRELKDNEEVAQSFKIEAKKLEITVQKMNAAQQQDEALLEVYHNLVTKWEDTRIAYAFLLVKAETLKIDRDLELFQQAALEAKTQEAFWKAHECYLAASQQEERVNNGDRILTLEEVVLMEEAWQKARGVCEEAQEQAMGTTLAEKKKIAEEKSTFWREKKEELMKGAKNYDNIKKKTPIQVQRLNQEVRNFIWSPEIHHAYQHYSLLEEIPGVTQFEVKREVFNEENLNKESIKPEQLDRELEEQGKKLVQNYFEMILKKNSISSAKGTDAVEGLSSTKEAALPVVDENGRTSMRQLILRESLNQTPINQERWEARRRADLYIQRAAEVAKRFEVEKSQTKKETEGEQLEVKEQSTIWDQMTSALGWNPKINVVGSRKGSTITSEMKSSLQQQSSIDLEIPQHPTIRDLARFNNLADQAERTWEELVKKGTLFPEQTELWFQADRKAIKQQDEEVLEKKRKKIAEALQENWESETRRWRARYEADQKGEALEILKNRKRDLEAEIVNYSTQLASRRYEVNQLGRNSESIEELERLTQKIKEQEDNLQEISSKTQCAIFEKSEAENRWLLLAEEEKSVKKKLSVEDHQESLEFVRESDRATYQLWERLKKGYEEELITNLSYLELGEELDNKEAFKKEIESIPQDENYEASLKKIALKAAREKISGAEEILLSYLKKQEKASPLIKGVAAKAYEVFQQEERRLADIESLWTGIIEAKRHHLLAAREKAARDYWKGDSASWEQLPLEAKEQYNDKLHQLNEHAQMEAEERLHFARERAKQWRDYLASVQRRAWRTSRTELENVKKQTEEAETKLFWMEKKKEFAQEAIGVMKRDAEKEKEIGILQTQLGYASANEKEASTKIEALKNSNQSASSENWRHAQKTWKKACQHLEKTIETLRDRNPFFPFWKEVDEIYIQAAEFYKKAAEQYELGNMGGLGGGLALSHAATMKVKEASFKTQVVDYLANWRVKQQQAMSRGDQEEVQILEEAMQLAKKAKEFYQEGIEQSIQTNQDGKNGMSNLLNASDEMMKQIKIQIEKVLPWRVKEKEAIAKGQKKEAQLWRKAITLAIQAAHLHSQSAKQYAAEGNQDNPGGGADLSRIAHTSLKQAEEQIADLAKIKKEPWRLSRSQGNYDKIKGLLKSNVIESNRLISCHKRVGFLETDAIQWGVIIKKMKDSDIFKCPTIVDAKLFDGLLVYLTGNVLVGLGWIDRYTYFDPSGIGSIKENRRLSLQLYQNATTTSIEKLEELGWVTQFREEAYQWLQHDDWRWYPDEINGIIEFLSVGLDEYKEDDVSRKVREKWTTYEQERKSRKSISGLK